VAGLEKLQDALGDLNDITVHAEMTERIVDAQDASGGRAKKAFAAGAFLVVRRRASARY
jgi:CHAD domain-containing protein